MTDDEILDNLIADAKNAEEYTISSVHTPSSRNIMIGVGVDSGEISPALTLFTDTMDKKIPSAIPSSREITGFTYLLIFCTPSAAILAAFFCEPYLFKRSEKIWFTYMVHFLVH